MTMVSKESAIDVGLYLVTSARPPARDLMSTTGIRPVEIPLGHLHARERPDELPEQPAAEPDDRDAQDHRQQVRGAQQEQREDEHDERQQRLEAEHRPVAHA